MKGEDMAAELLGLAEKGSSVMEEQENFVEAHSKAIGHHMKLLQREKDMLSKMRSGDDDTDVDYYVDGLEVFLKQRRQLDDILLKQLLVFKGKLKEEEDEHFRVTQGLRKMA